MGISEMTGGHCMSHESNLTKKQWEGLLTSVQQLCRIYWGPSEALSRQMLEKDFLQPFNAVTPLIETHADAELVELRTLLDGFSGPESLLADLEEGYVRLFINDRGGIAAPLYASCYEDEKNPHLMGKAAARMQKTLSDLKIHISDDVREPPDHLSIELEVLYFLLTQKRTPDHPKGLTAAANFTDEQMLPWVQAFHRRLADEVRCRFYPLITSVLLSVLQAVAALPESGIRHRSQ